MTDAFANLKVTEYIHRALVGYVIMIGLGMGMGYITLALLVDVWGRKRMLLLSYTVLVILFVVLAACWEKLNSEAAISLVCLAFFTQITGPRGVAYVYATELFPRSFRNWCFLIVDIFGSLGAIVGIAGVTALMHLQPESERLRSTWIALAVFTFSGLVSTFGLIETARKEIGVIEGESYGDWGKWGDRRKMRPEGAQDGDSDKSEVVLVFLEFLHCGSHMHMHDVSFVIGFILLWDSGFDYAE
ncbi:hypothetical protein ABW21_db0205710 [Orbilia brochopaga]|nr:hypothetical protein ABW21_db0205710 [Drechslerella brochopaga]